MYPYYGNGATCRTALVYGTYMKLPYLRLKGPHYVVVRVPGSCMVHAGYIRMPGFAGLRNSRYMLPCLTGLVIC